MKFEGKIAKFSRISVKRGPKREHNEFKPVLRSQENSPKKTFCCATTRLLEFSQFSKTLKAQNEKLSRTENHSWQTQNSLHK